MKKNLINFTEKAKAARISFIVALLMVNWGCAVKSPQVTMRGIDKVNGIQFDDVAVNAKETVPIAATINIETQSGIPAQYERQLKEKIKKPLFESLNRVHLFNQINDGSLGNTESDISINIKYAYENQAYDDVGYMPLACLTLLIVTPSHVVTQGTADVIINSKFSRESMRDKFNVEGEGWTTTGIAGHGDALAKALRTVTQELIKKSLDFIANNTNYYHKIGELKKDNNGKQFASREDRGAFGGEAALSPDNTGDLSVWEPYKKDNTAEGYEEFLANHPTNIYCAEATALLENLRAYQQANSRNTVPAYAEFLRAQPSSPNRGKALATMCKLIEKQKDPHEGFKKFITEFEDGAEFVPTQYRLALIGPEGMRVADILELLNQGVEGKVIAAKIRMQNGIYKNFDVKELGALKKMGVTGVLIEAMLDSTTRAKREQEELRKKKEMEDLLAEIQRTQKKLNEMKASQEGQQSEAPASAGQNSEPSVGDTVKNCSAQIAALEACKHLPWPASTVCAAAAKSQFPCQ
jgi:uncharacterized protein YwgA